MKKIISVFLVISLLASLLGISASAAQAYPESKHDYENYSEETWEYKTENPVKGLYVTFSSDTYVEPYVKLDSKTPVPEEMMEDEGVKELALGHGEYEKGDYITFFDYYDYWIKSPKFSGSELAGKTVYFKGNYFKIMLTSDSSVTGYGFKIDKIEEDEANPEEVGIFNYLIDGKIAASSCFEDGETVILDEFYHNYHSYSDNKAIVGWKTEDGKEIYYNNSIQSVKVGKYHYEKRCITKTDIIAEAGKEYNLYPIYCKLGMTSEETLSFNNTDTVFDRDFGGYVYTQEAFRHQFIDWIATFGLSPLFPLAIIGIAFNTFFWPDSVFCGSCCGFPITTILQHYGKIDILSEQGVDKVSELEPTDELLSTINFYNNAAEAAHLVNHWACDPGTKEYTRQLKDLYAVLEEGTPVYFEFYPDGEPPLKSISAVLSGLGQTSLIDAAAGAHGILLDGAFTDSEGNHIFLGWDNNSSQYSNGHADVLIVDKDFSEITYMGPSDVHYCSQELNGFAWNDDLSTFESFPTEGTPNPFPWHINFIEHIFELICHSITNLFN